MDTELAKGTLALLILSLVSREPMYGYQLTATVRKETNGAFDWKEGSLYPALHNLEKAGLLRSAWEASEGGRRRKYYHLTDKGRKALAQKRQSWDMVARSVQAVLEKSDGRD